MSTILSRRNQILAKWSSLLHNVCRRECRHVSIYELQMYIFALYYCSNTAEYEEEHNKVCAMQHSMQQFPCYSPFSLSPGSRESVIIVVYCGQNAREEKTSRNGPLDAPAAFQNKPTIFGSQRKLESPLLFSLLPSLCLLSAKSLAHCQSV